MVNVNLAERLLDDGMVLNASFLRGRERREERWMGLPKPSGLVLEGGSSSACSSWLTRYPSVDLPRQVPSDHVGHRFYVINEKSVAGGV